jgi:hypothetical protein
VANFQYPNTKSAFTISSATPAILSYQDQSSFLTAKSNGISTVYVFSAALNKTNSNFQNSPLIVPTFYNMAQNDQKTGVVSMKIGENNPFIVDAELAKDEILEVKSTSKTTGEKFIPVQQILNNKAKLTFNDLPKEAGNYGIFNQNKLIKNISFNYSRTEGNIDNSNIDALSNYKIVESIESVFDTLKFDRQDTSIWKWFVFLTLLFLVLEILIQKFVK